jgi:pimeloyl-ACP methyl ester carboxylesterase
VDTIRTVTAAGRRIGVADYGDPDGWPVFYFHGTPASRLGFERFDGVIRGAGVRLLGLDRAGIGLSDPVPGRRLVDYPTEVTAVADALGIDRFSAWGWSGGGPYAFACAYALDDRLHAVGSAAGAGPVASKADAARYEKTDRQLLGLSRKAPWAGRAVLSVLFALARRRPDLAAASFTKQLSPSDRADAEKLGSPAEIMSFFVEAGRQGSAGVIEDYRVWGSDWGFALEDITRAVHVWQGDADQLVPPDVAQSIIDRLKEPIVHSWPGEGHLAVYPHLGEILTTLRPA